MIDAAAGNDPALAKRERRLERSDFVEDVVAEFVERVLKVQQRRWAATEAIMNDKLIRRWKGRPIGQIRKSDVLKMLDREMDAGHGRMANRTLQISRQFFSWAMERGYLDYDPTVGINRPAKERARDRVLSSAELSVIWQASSQLGNPFGTIVKLLLLLGQRRAEVADMRWSELNLEMKVWTIPSSRTKNGRPHDVPLATPVVEILTASPKMDGRLFPSVRKLSDRSVSGFSKAKRRIDAVILDDWRRQAAALERSTDDVEPLAPWVLHDLRRTLVTGMAELGVRPHVIEAVVNHVSGHKAGVAGIYNRATYAAEKREALERWSSHVASIMAQDVTGLEA